MKITFGKYKNQEIEEVINNDPSYCKWLSNQPFTNEDMKKYIKEHLDMGQLTMRWGKHKDKTITWIKENDAKYIDWLKQNDFVKDKCKELLEAL